MADNFRACASRTGRGNRRNISHQFPARSIPEARLRITGHPGTTSLVGV
jgi:hypothetical protein